MEASWLVMSRITPPPRSGEVRRHPARRSGSSPAWKTRMARGSPMSPRATSWAMARLNPDAGRWWLVASTTPARSQAPTISHASSSDIASGFSQSTCLPAAAAATVWAWWSSLVVLT
jgi:hypothetical protein